MGTANFTERRQRRAWDVRPHRAVVPAFPHLVNACREEENQAEATGPRWTECVESRRGATACWFRTLRGFNGSKPSRWMDEGWADGHARARVAVAARIRRRVGSQFGNFVGRGRGHEFNKRSRCAGLSK